MVQSWFRLIQNTAKCFYTREHSSIYLVEAWGKTLVYLNWTKSINKTLHWQHLRIFLNLTKISSHSNTQSDQFSSNKTLIQMSHCHLTALDLQLSNFTNQTNSRYSLPTVYKSILQTPLRLIHPHFQMTLRQTLPLYSPRIDSLHINIFSIIH
jgi:hypothetical protein